VRAIFSASSGRAYAGSPSTSTPMSSPAPSRALNQRRNDALLDALRLSHWPKVPIEAGPNAARYAGMTSRAA